MCWLCGYAGADGVDAVFEAGLGGAQPGVGSGEVFEVGGEALLELGELGDGEGGEVDGVGVGGLGLRHGEIVAKSMVL